MMRRIALIIAIALMAQVAESAEYYASFDVNRHKVGSFIVYDRPGSDSATSDIYVEGAALRALRLPVVADVPLSTLGRYGNYEWNQEEQTLSLTTSKLSVFAATGGTEGMVGVDLIPLPTSRFAVKSLDYQLFGATDSRSNISKQASLTGTGRAFGLDVDINLFTESRPGGTVNWHEEKNEYVKDVKVGAVPLAGVDRGVGLTNETTTRFQSSFGTEQVVTDYPIGTKIDIYRGSDIYVGSVTSDKPQYIVSLPLTYGSTSYLLRAFLPSGEMREKVITRDVDAYMTMSGAVSYNIAGGVDRFNHEVFQTRASYGLNNKVTLYADADKSQGGAGAYFTPVAGWVLNGHAGSRGFSGSSYYNNQSLGAYSASYSDQAGIKSLSGIVAPRLMYSPVVVLTHTNSNNIDTTVGSLRAGLNYNRLYLSPRVEFSETKSAGITTVTRGAGAQAILMLPRDVTLRTDSLYTLQPGMNVFTSDIDLEKRIQGIGSVDLKTHLIGQQGRLRADTTGVALQLQNWKYASLSLGYTHSWQDHNDTVTASLSGSLTRAGVSNLPQAQSASILVRTYVDRSGKGRFLEGVDELVKTGLTIDQRDVDSDGEYVMHSLLPYVPYEISVTSKVDMEPVVANFKVVPVRGEVSVVDIAYKRVLTFDGRVDSHESNELVEVLLTNGKYKQVYSSDSGYWSTRIREDLVPAQFEVKKAVKPAKPGVGPEIAVAKPVETAKIQVIKQETKVVEPVAVVTPTAPVAAKVVAVKAVKTSKKAYKYYIVAAYAASEIKAQAMAIKVKDWLNKEGKAVKIKTFITAGKEHVDVIKPSDCLAFLEDCYKLVASKTF